MWCVSSRDLYRNPFHNLLTTHFILAIVKMFRLHFGNAGSNFHVLLDTRELFFTPCFTHQSNAFGAGIKITKVSGSFLIFPKNVNGIILAKSFSVCTWWIDMELWGREDDVCNVLQFWYVQFIGDHNWNQYSIHLQPLTAWPWLVKS